MLDVENCRTFLTGPLSRTRWILALTSLLLLYTVMTGLQPSAVRASIMGIAYWSLNSALKAFATQHDVLVG